MATVVFSPIASGAASGTITITSASLASPVTASLTGTGFNFTVSVEATSTQSVAAGQTASYTLELNPSGAGATFTLACGPLPQYAACTFNPATETLSSGVEGNMAVNISTGQASTAQVEPVAGWRVAPLLCGLLLLPLAFARKRRVLLLAVLACVLTAGITACTSSGLGTGGGGGGQKQNTTPPGTYTIQVTATANGLSLPVTLTLTVD
jgi:hypothetical protein